MMGKICRIFMCKSLCLALKQDVVGHVSTFNLDGRVVIVYGYEDVWGRMYVGDMKEESAVDE